MTPETRLIIFIERHTASLAVLIEQGRLTAGEAIVLLDLYADGMADVAERISNYVLRDALMDRHAHMVSFLCQHFSAKPDTAYFLLLDEDKRYQARHADLVNRLSGFASIHRPDSRRHPELASVVNPKTLCAPQRSLLEFLDRRCAALTITVEEGHYTPARAMSMLNLSGDGMSDAAERLGMQRFRDALQQRCGDLQRFLRDYFHAQPEDAHWHRVPTTDDLKCRYDTLLQAVQCFQAMRVLRTQKLVADALARRPR